MDARRDRGARARHGVLPGRRPLRDLLGVALVAACLWAAFPPVGAWPASIVGMALFVALLDRVGAGRAAWLAFLVGLGFWLPHVEWVRVATGGWLPWVVLCATQALAFAGWGWIVSLARVLPRARTWWGQVLVTSVSWVGVEQVRSSWPWTGFPWAKLAYPQVDSPLGQLAPLGGEVLVSLLVVVVAVLLRRAFSLHPAHEVRRWWVRPTMLLGALALLVAPLATTLSNSQQAGSLRVGVVQGDVEVPGARTYSVEGKVTSNNVHEMRRLLQSGAGVDLVVWGEGSLDRDPAVSPLVSGMVSSVVDEGGVPTVVGFNRYFASERVIRNYIGVWYPGRGLGPDLYGKQEPVPFGEFIPWRRFVAALATEAAQVRVDMVGADNAAVLPVTLADGRRITLATGICFEVGVEDLIGRGVGEGGTVIVVPSNNYHFRTSAESAQQAQMLRLRAMEFSRSAVQASTNGISVIVRPDGSVVGRTAPQTADHLVAEVPLRTGLTPIARAGNLPAALVEGATGALVLLSLISCLALTRRKNP